MFHRDALRTLAPLAGAPGSFRKQIERGEPRHVGGRQGGRQSRKRLAQGTLFMACVREDGRGQRVQHPRKEERLESDGLLARAACCRRRSRAINRSGLALRRSHAAKSAAANRLSAANRRGRGRRAPSTRAATRRGERGMSLSRMAGNLRPGPPLYCTIGTRLIVVYLRPCRGKAYRLSGRGGVVRLLAENHDHFALRFHAADPDDRAVGRTRNATPLPAALGPTPLDTRPGPGPVGLAGRRGCLCCEAVAG